MATLVHNSSSNILAQPRPSSAAGLLESKQSSELGQRGFNNAPQLSPRSLTFSQGFASANMVGGGAYRGISSAPIAPYAFTSTPSAPSNLQPRQPSNKIDQQQHNQPRFANDASSQRHRYPASASTSSTVSSSSSSNPSMTYTPSAAQPHMGNRLGGTPFNAPAASATTHSGNLGVGLPASVRPSPDRYRRGPRRADSAQSQPKENALYNQPGKARSSSSLPLNSSIPATHNTVDDAQAYRPLVQRNAVSERENINRRRSFGAFDGVKPLDGNRRLSYAGHHARTNSFPAPGQPAQANAPRTLPVEQSRNVQPPMASFARRDSADSASSNKSGGSSGSHTNTAKSSAQGLPSSSSSPVSGSHEIPSGSVPFRGSSADPARRAHNPSPLSKPMSMSPELGTVDSPPPSRDATNLPQLRNSTNAADRLAAIQMDSKKGLKSRLRRAFSFGSATELRQASSMSAEQRARLRQEREEAEQARIAEKQEAGGLGNAIYSNNQGNIFSSSTDNLSISSTASSASVMLRKMGKGMKRGSRSLVGLFRPKSVVGVAPSSPGLANPNIDNTTAQVSMVTVEAEREKVNVNLDPHDQAGGGTGFPKLERNSLDAARRAAENIEEPEANARRSIVGRDKDRAEVLAAIKKGILKRSTSSSPIVKAADKSADFQLPQIPSISSQPSSPENLLGSSNESNLNSNVDGPDGDYFLAPSMGKKLSSPRSSAISAPVTPQEVKAAKFSVSFSPRITFHDTWPSGEYDRRGEISTCNRLTPMLAQQIKEELNTFKMEMEVHEESKIYTHFF